MFRSFASILSAVIVTPVIVIAQAKTIYYNSDGKETAKDSASYYSIAELQQGGEYYVQDHYLNGHLQMTGYYTCASLDDSCRTGHTVFYDSLGNVESEGEYNKGMHSGIWKYYYAHSADLKAEEIYQADTSPAIYVGYDSILHHKIETGHILNGKKNGAWQEYYASNGLLKATFFYKDGVKEGMYTEYDIQMHTPLMKGMLLHDKRAGAWGYYTPAGNTALIMNFEDDLPEGPATFYNPRSHKKWKEYNFHKGRRVGRAYIYFPNGNMGAELNYRDDSLDGEQKYYYLSGIVNRVDHYNNGTFINGKCYDKKGNPVHYTPLSSDMQTAIRAKPYQNIMSGYSQSEDGFGYDEQGNEKRVTVSCLPMPSVDINKFFKRNLHYPAKALENGIDGVVVLKFIVLKDGRISDVQVLRGIGGGCDEEAVRVLNLMPRWRPGMNNGEPVDVNYRLPVPFTLITLY